MPATHERDTLQGGSPEIKSISMSDQNSDKKESKSLPEEQKACAILCLGTYTHSD